MCQPDGRSTVCLARSENQLPLEEGEMAIATRRARPVESPQALPRHQLWAVMCKFVRTKPLVVAGGAVIVCSVFAAVPSAPISPCGLEALHQLRQLTPPLLGHVLGP